MLNKATEPMQKQPTSHSAIQWQQPLGVMLSAAEKHSLDKTLPQIFGYHAVQMGRLDQPDWLLASPIRQKVYFSEEIPRHRTNLSLICGNYYQLPFAPQSIDLFLLAHSLEFSSHPLTLLGEIHCSLMSEGRIIILGFNPLSLWGITRYIIPKHFEFLWPRNVINLSRMRKLLDVADFEIEEIKGLFFRPPLINKNRLQRLNFLEKLGQTLWPCHGAVYQIKAKKRVVTLTPIKPRWQTSRELLAKGLAEPSANTKG
ncbi:class I SAM-dependent methyltransferase [soil metagenome]